MTYSGVTVHRDWVEQARLLFTNELDAAKAVLAMLDYALYDKEPSDRNKTLKGYIIGLKKPIQMQRTRYANMARARTGKYNSNSNSNSNSTSATDEEGKKLLESIKIIKSNRQ